MKQHFLPKIYLEGFCDPDCPEGHDPFVWKIELVDAEWKKRAPQNIAFIPDMYCFEGDDGEKLYELDKAITTEEGKASSIIKNKIYQKQLIDEEEKMILSGFIALFAIRVPAWLKKIDNMQVDRVKIFMDMTAMHPEALESMINEYEKETGKKAPDNLKPEDFMSKNFDITPSRNATLEIAMSVAPTIQMIIKDMKWMFVCTTPDKPFITSDHPYVLWNSNLKNPMNGPGLAQRDVELTIPISSEFLLSMTWQDRPEIDYTDISASDYLIKGFNMRTIMRSDKMLISSKQTFPGDHLVENWLTKRKARKE